MTEHGEQQKADADLVHKFERAGLGKAPYKMVGFERRTYQACLGAPVQVGGSCDYCSTGIIETFIVESADGRRFKVGNECIKRAGDRGLISLSKKALNKVRREARHEREAARITAAQAALPQVAAALQAKPHPHANPEIHSHFDRKTALDFVRWMLANAGNAGKIRAAKVVEQAQREAAAKAGNRI